MNKIAEMRKSKGISQIELAKELHIAQNTLSQYENEVRRPTPRIIRKIADFFDVSPNYVLGLPEPPKDDEVSCKFSLSKVTKIESLDSDSQVNMYLSLGWRLLHVGQVSEYREDRTGYSEIVYTLGWFGDPKDTLQNGLAEDGDEQYNELGFDGI